MISFEIRMGIFNCDCSVTFQIIDSYKCSIFPKASCSCIQEISQFHLASSAHISLGCGVWEAGVCGLIPALNVNFEGRGKTKKSLLWGFRRCYNFGNVISGFFFIFGKRKLLRVMANKFSIVLTG